jgi:hypothetical protein
LPATTLTALAALPHAALPCGRQGAALTLAVKDRVSGRKKDHGKDSEASHLH